jgi:HlyD family secretion protein
MKLKSTLLPISTILVVIISGCSQFTESDAVDGQSSVVLNNPETPSIVTALGRIEPNDKVIHVSGSSQLVNGRVIEIFVEEGDIVEPGQLIALFDNFYIEKAALEAANQSVQVVRAQLNQVLQGESKKAEILAQQAEISRLEAQLRNEITEKTATIERVEAELRNAERSYERFQSLYEEGAVSILDLDDRGEQLETARARLKEVTAQLQNVQSSLEEQLRREQAILATLKEVRPVDIEVARAKLEEAIAKAAQAKANLELSQVRAPVQAEVLKLHIFPGERVDSAGILDLGQVQQMYVSAEVYENDIAQVKVGQSAVISGGPLQGTLQGTVERVSSQLGKRDLFSTDPTLDIDARVFEVKIRLSEADNAQASKLINSQVDVKINI